jgi:hypothetical protein
LQEDILEPMESLRHLAIGTYPALKRFDILQHIAKLPVLRHLDIEVRQRAIERHPSRRGPPKFDQTRGRQQSVPQFASYLAHLWCIHFFKKSKIVS